MNNIFKYIQKYGDLTFEEKSVSVVDILIFSQIPYLNFKEEIPCGKEGIKLSILWKKIRKYNTEGKGLPQKSATRILDMLSIKKRYKDLILKDYKYHLASDTQFGAISIIVPNDYVYAVFEGTDGTVSGWKEDFNLAYVYPTVSQKLATEYLNDLIKLSGPKIVVCGHSKGGNLALASSMNINILKKSKIHKIYSFDGPGLKMEEFKSVNYKLVRNKLVNIIPNLSLVGVLLMQENLTVIKSIGIGVYQHDVTTWIVEDDNLKRATQHKLSKRLDKSIGNWLDKYNYEERKQIIEGIFSILEKANIQNFYDIKENKLKSIYAIFKSSLDISKETREVILNSIKLLALGFSSDIINDGKKLVHDNIESLKKKY